MATTSSSSLTFGALLRRHRLAAALTQEALAERAGVSARGLQLLEANRTVPRAETVRLLADAFGLDPAARAAFITAANPELAVPGTPSRVPAPTAPRIPVPPTPLVGREREVAEACALLRQPARLLAVTGPGGVGKTRLALAVAAELAPEFADGVAWVELAPLRDPDLVATAIADALGVREMKERPLAETLLDSVAQRRQLLVLDNFEHLPTAAPLVAALLAAGPHLAVLVTSRARLRLRGERELAIGPLAVPDADGCDAPLAGLAGVAAVRLFVERAVEVNPGFALTADNAAAISAICRRLDGLPLALELAAARVKVLPPSDLLARLERRLPLLRGGARDAPARQQTMRDAIAWSYDLLTAEEQAHFRRLAVFAGGFTLEAAEWVSGGGFRVAGTVSAARPPDAPLPPEPPSTGGGSLLTPDTLDLVSSLLDHSLVQRTSAPTGAPRYRMLETIREFGLEQLTARDEEDAVRDAHAAWYLDLAGTAEVGLRGSEQVAWLDRLESEHDNLRGALEWLPRCDAVESALRLAGSLWFFRWLRGYYAESRAQFATLLAHPAAANRTPARAKALNGFGVTVLSQGDTQRATAAHEEALAISRHLGDEPGMAFSLVCLGTALMRQADFGRAEAVTAESLAICRRLGDDWGMQMALANLAFPALHAGDNERAEALFRESLAIGRRVGERWGTALDLDNLGWLALERGDDHEAASLFEESLSTMRELGDRRDLPDALAGLGLAAQLQGDFDRATTLYEEALAITRDTGDQQGMAQTLYRLAHVAWQQSDGRRALALLQEVLARYHAMGDLLHVAAALEAIAVLVGAGNEAARAAHLLGASAELFAQVAATIPRFDRFDVESATSRAREAIGAEAFAAAYAAGRTMPLEQAVSEAMACADDIA